MSDWNSVDEQRAKLHNELIEHQRRAEGMKTSPGAASILGDGVSQLNHALDWAEMVRTSFGKPVEVERDIGFLQYEAKRRLRHGESMDIVIRYRKGADPGIDKLLGPSRPFRLPIEVTVQVPGKPLPAPANSSEVIVRNPVRGHAEDWADVQAEAKRLGTLEAKSPGVIDSIFDNAVAREELAGAIMPRPPEESENGYGSAHNRQVIAAIRRSLEKIQEVRERIRKAEEAAGSLTVPDRDPQAKPTVIRKISALIDDLDDKVARGDAGEKPKQEPPPAVVTQIPPDAPLVPTPEPTLSGGAGTDTKLASVPVPAGVEPRLFHALLRLRAANWRFAENYRIATWTLWAQRHASVPPVIPHPPVSIDLEVLRQLDGRSAEGGATEIGAALLALMRASPEQHQLHTGLGWRAENADPIALQRSLLCGRYIYGVESLRPGDLVRIVDTRMPNGHAWGTAIAAESTRLKEVLLCVSGVYERRVGDLGVPHLAWRSEPDPLFADGSELGRFYGTRMARMARLVENHIALGERDFLEILLEGTGWKATSTRDLARQLGGMLVPVGPLRPAMPGSVVFNADLSRCGVRLANGSVKSWSFVVRNHSTFGQLADLGAGPRVWMPRIARGVAAHTMSAMTAHESDPQEPSEFASGERLLSPGDVLEGEWAPNEQALYTTVLDTPSRRSLKAYLWRQSSEHSAPFVWFTLGDTHGGIVSECAVVASAVEGDLTRIADVHLDGKTTGEHRLRFRNASSDVAVRYRIEVL